MPDSNWVQPENLVKLEVLMLSIAELSCKLSEKSAAHPQLSFEPHPAGTIASSESDAIVSFANDGYRIQITEPVCGKPVMVLPPEDSSLEARMTLWFVRSIDSRRSKLLHLTSALLKRFPDFPNSGIDHGIWMSDLAALCGMSLATTNRVLNNKIVQTPNGPLAYYDFIQIQGAS